MAKIKRPQHPPDPVDPTPPVPPVVPTEPEPEPPTEVAESDRDIVVRCALENVGKPYVWGTHGPTTFDCSGYVGFCYRRAGVDVGFGSVHQYTLGERVEGPQPGDVGFWDTFGAAPGHNAIYIGDNKIAHAFNENEGVVITQLPVKNMGGNNRFMGWRNLGLTGKVSEPEPEPGPQPTNLAPLPITEKTPYLRMGDYPRKAWSESLLANSPMRDDLDAILLASQGVGILAREQALKESSDGADATARQARNPLGLMVRNAATEPYILTAAGRKLKVFSTWADAFKEFKRRLTDPKEAYISVGVKTLGEYIERYQLGWIPGDPNRPLPAGESVESMRLYKSQVISRANTRIEAYGRVGESTPPDPTEPTNPLEGFKSWTIPGLSFPMVLPEAITVEIDLTPVGVHRPGNKINRTGSTLHETGNRGATAGARMHSSWQDNCTEGHPDRNVGVTMYVEDRLVIIKIPLDEGSIHAGDWRNNAHDSMEVCVNAGRNAEQTEDTAMWVKASILHGSGQNADEHLYPHRPSGCPAIINSQGRWPDIERGVTDRIAILDGGTAPPPRPTYAEAFPVPKEWDGTDYVRSDGQRFYALQRVFVTSKITSAHQSADPASPKVRADLKKGEAFLSHYITKGVGGMWLVSQYGSRILAADTLPRLGVLVDGNWMGDRPDGEEDIILVEADRGLSGTEVPEDAPALDKQTFMRV